MAQETIEIKVCLGTSGLAAGGEGNLEGRAGGGQEDRLAGPRRLAKSS